MKQHFLVMNDQTGGNLFLRSHTFGKNPRKGGAGAGDMKPVNYYE